MSYTLHSFVPGTRFYASDANEMDAQIAENTTNIASLESFRQNIESTLLTCFQRLSLDVDSDVIYLKYGDYLLDSVAVPLDIDGYIPCTNVAIDDVTGDVIMYIGDTKQFSATRSPSNTSQNARWILNDLISASVTSSGLVTALGIGICTLSADCGAYRDTVTIDIRRKVDFTDTAMLCNWISYESSAYHRSINISGLSSTDLPQMVAPLPYSIQDMSIPDGCTVSLSLVNNSSRVALRCYVLQELPGETITLVNNFEEAENLYRLENVTILDQNTTVHKRSQNSEGVYGYWGQNSYQYSNTSGETVYFMFVVQDEGPTWVDTADQEENAVNFLENGVNLVIYKTPEVGD